MKIIDTHTHLCDLLFDADLEQVLKRAEEKGVAAIISVSENLADAEKNLRTPMTLYFRATFWQHPT